MILEVIKVFPNQLPVSFKDQQVFRVFLFRCLGEVETSRYQRLPVDNHDFIVGNSVLVIDHDRNAGIVKESCRGVSFLPLAFVQNGLDPDPSFFCLQQSPGDVKNLEKI
jgi:hypothetical protein